jgi:hypothetical protein
MAYGLPPLVVSSCSTAARAPRAWPERTIRPPHGPLARARYESLPAGPLARSPPRTVSAQQPRTVTGDDAHDEFFPLIVAMADAGHDSAGSARPRCADAGCAVPPGVVAAQPGAATSAARRTLAEVTRSPGGVAEALVAISGEARPVSSTGQEAAAARRSPRPSAAE